ncbi:hypothetical protein [Bailinhaonella thermotolerans]|uniref:hypothetical protein n=1 Tax=Bailinhaonella thermotolerans TaxID=1070861 RepID=UPI00192A331A|nr:hypothetical protein [Bailinhaonella thermotolerans]
MTAPDDTAARYRRPVPVLWWTGRRPYLLFMIREFSSVFVAWSVVYLLLLVRAVAAGPAAYRGFMELSASWWMLALNVAALALTLFHTITWFVVTPKAVAVRVLGVRLPAFMVAGPLYTAWIAVSAFVVWLLVR